MRGRSAGERGDATASTSAGEAGIGVDAPVESDGSPEVPIDVAARQQQLIELDDALRRLARAMAADQARMANPGWAGKVADYRTVAADAARMERDGFDRAALTDLASQVVPLYAAGRAEPPPEYAAVLAEHERVMAAVQALRETLPSEGAG